MINSSGHQWADLPKELLEIIEKCFDSRIDILRCRSVCSSWRSSVSFRSFDEEIPPLILKLPQPISADAVLCQSIICRGEFTRQPLDSPSSSSSASKQKGWLIKIRESRIGKLKLLHPLSDCKIRTSPLKLNLLNFRFIQLSKAFMLKSPSGYSAFRLNEYPSGCSVYGINKVVLFPVSASLSKDGFAILAIFHEGKLGYWKYGDESWTLLDDTNFQYDDIIEYKSQFYVVDRWGTIYWIDSSLRVLQYSPSLFGCGGQKNLVESCGNLYVVDRYLDGERKTWKDYEDSANFPPHWRWSRKKGTPNTIDIRVHMLDEEWGTWVDVKSLGDRVFILGIDCSFSISCDEFFGGKGNCIYLTDDDDYTGSGLSNDSIRVFRLEDHVIEKVEALPGYSQLFWSPNFSNMTDICVENQSG